MRPALISVGLARRVVSRATNAAPALLCCVRRTSTRCALRCADLVLPEWMSSSALSNALFCRPGCRILGLIHEERSFNFRGYTSFIEAGGARILFLRGRTLPRPGVHAFHVSYTVDPGQVRPGLVLS